MQKGCKVCKSSHVEDYEKLWTSGATFMELENISKTQFNESISTMTLQRHMIRCLPLKGLKNVSSTVSAEGIELSSIDSLIEAKKDLELLIGVATNAFKIRPTPQSLTALANAFDRKRAFLETIDRLEKEEKVNAVVDDKRILEVLLWATDFMCPDCQKTVSQKVVERLKSGDMGTSPKV